MKKNILTTLASILTIISLWGQQLKPKELNNSLSFLEKGMNTSTLHKVNVESAGTYYLNFLLLGAKTNNGNYKTFPLKLNGITVDTITSRTANWHRNQTHLPLYFHKGENIVEILDSAPHIANVCDIKISTDILSNLTEIATLSNENKSINTSKSTSFPKNTSSFDKSFNLYTEDNTNFPFEASCLIGYKARYTFHEFLNCKEGDTLSIYTNVNDGGPYVVDVNFYNDPSVFSKTLENPTGAFLKEICIPKSGTYIVVLRATEYDYDGTCDIGINKQMHENVPFSYVDFKMPLSKYNGNLVFAQNVLDIIPSISVQNKSNTVIDNGTYQYYGTRSVELKNKDEISSISIYSFSPIRPYYPVDIYFNANQLTNESIIQNFKWNNEFIPVVAPKDPDYNCFAWSVGIWDHWEDPTDDFMTDKILNSNDWPEELYYDDFFNFNGYERSDKNSATICLWGFKDGQDSTFVHASIRKFSNADSIPHGYCWESKMGALERVYHTEEHIMMDKERRRYGEPLAYYKPISKTYRKSILEKVADDEVSILTSNIKSNNINYIASNIKSINGSIIKEFNRLYSNWKTDIRNSSYSTLRELRQFPSYTEIKSYVNKHPSLQYAIMNLVYSDDQFALALTEDIILPQNKDAYKKLGEQLKNAKLQNVEKEIYSSGVNNAKMFLNLLLDKMSTSTDEENNDVNYSLSNNSKMAISCIGTTCNIRAEINPAYNTNCRIYNINGELVSTLKSQKQSSEGIEVFSHNLNQNGTYIIYLENGNNINVKKITIK